ncbi:6-hydroxymethylpterin diphosphokinase MptE-like protein [Catenovulum maritimum]|uniref:6-hydroxymethylpterin diphosphokinase MptE-like protein n=1 Tax=Catenovulum maritimum TaxID=1513271 RepID=UPI00069DDDC3|nr:6-hydroxymethylpterin diphosphokinase MptE-like protein [Catenovulum maritimum]
MLKDIRFHVEKDEKKQLVLEQKLSSHIQMVHKKNLTAFARHIPSLIPSVQNISSQNIAVFANKESQYNFVDYSSGRVLYGLFPEREIQNQVQTITNNLPYISFEYPNQPSEAELSNSSLNSLDSYQIHQVFKPAPEAIDVLVVFGIGLGIHIKELVNSYKIKHLIIYEPELQYFQCSTLVTDWEVILEQIELKSTSVYFQIGKDGRDIIDNINELSLHFPIKGFHFYKHYNHPIFDAIDKTLKHEPWNILKSSGIHFNASQNPNDYLPAWTPSAKLDDYVLLESEKSEIFNSNLLAFKKYFPDIYHEFKSYSAKNFIPIQNSLGEVNILKKEELLTLFGQSPKTESILSLEHFGRYPNKDGLVLGYTGKKLKHYSHYKYIEKTEKILSQAEENEAVLPKEIKSLIQFGIGAGYQLEKLVEEHLVEKLFICEPNRDFFFASLFAIDWKGILEKIDLSSGRLYINIGDDGTNLFRDLLNQFYAIGPYVLANTYFYQCYYNANLVKTISQLREQLQVVICMGEYYDHARYGISQTVEIIERGHRFLTKSASKNLPSKSLDLPIFIVGNGPSLDYSINTIKEYQEQVIIVSCGTSLMSLYKQGITPDFHAEIEQNRSGFDWCVRVGDLDYLKQISLISCNGIHPDVCNLFKDVFVAFKEGESSTVSALEILGRDKYEELQFAFPTVSNFAINLFTKLGFNQLYLFGIDLGFSDSKKHHSTQSGYYKNNGDEVYAYDKENNTSLRVEGNYRPFVYTKHEFKVAKTIMEQSLAKVKVDCFNCSDGAKIANSQPLPIDLILVSSTLEDKTRTLAQIKQQAFAEIESYKNYRTRFLEKFELTILERNLKQLLNETDITFENIKQIETFVDNQKEMLFKSYKTGDSLLFYLLYGTTNYTNAALSKLTMLEDKSQSISLANQLIELWQEFLDKVKSGYLYQPWALDTTVSMAHDRILKFKKLCHSHLKIGYDLPDSMLNDFTKLFLAHYGPNAECRDLKMKNEIDSSLDCVIMFSDEELDFCRFENLLDALNYNNDKILIGSTRLELLERLDKFDWVSRVFWFDSIRTQHDIEEFKQGLKPEILDLRISILMSQFAIDVDKYELFIPKLQFFEGDGLTKEHYLTSLNNAMELNLFIEFPDYLAVPRCTEAIEDNDLLFDAMGNRGTLIKGKLALENLIGTPLTENRVKTIIDAVINGVK